MQQKKMDFTGVVCYSEKREVIVFCGFYRIPRKKVGERMSLEAMKLIDGAEAEALRRREEAMREARDTIAKAREEGERRLAEARRKGAEDAAKLLSEAAEQQKKRASDARSRSRQECFALRAMAEGRLDAAAQVIAERIVEG